MSATAFDILRNLGYGWAAYGVQISAGLIFGVVGVMAASLYFCPEANTLREAWSRLKSRRSLLLYLALVFSWALSNIVLPELYIPFTIVCLIAGGSYPTLLFWRARKRARSPSVKNAMATLTVTWSLFLSLGTFLFALGAQPPVLPVSLPYAWELAFLTGSVLFFSMSLVETSPLGMVRFPSGQLVPDTIIKTGHRYLILHDSGKRAISFLSSTLKGLIDSGARVIIHSPSSSWLVGGLSQNNPHFIEWWKNGRVVVSETGLNQNLARESITDMLAFGPTSTVHLSELGQDNLQSKISSIDSDRGEKHRDDDSELLLLESSKAPRPRLTDFLHENSDIELLNLSESTDSFSSLVNLDHQRIRGSIILLEYDSSSSYESAVDKFLTEGISNAELCVLFTTKSSKLYRAITGKRTIKIIAASSLISAPEELPDGEMEIPDKELGLVAAIVSNFLDNSKGSGASFVFDSIADLIRGERWEQVYAGIKQLIELLTVPNATALFLVNLTTSEPRFLGALHGSISLQLKMDAHGLTAIKIPTN